MTKALLWPLAFGITSKQFLQICHRKSTQFVSIASVSSLYSQEPGSIHTFNVAVGLASGVTSGGASSLIAIYCVRPAPGSPHSNRGPLSLHDGAHQCRK